jgi:tRNA threonylcarbamoyladenosine modification (KEOPS) complex Cgi121 subunit
VKFIQNKETNLKIFIGLIEVKLNLQELSPNKFLDLCNYVENMYNNALLQILNKQYILNSEHIFSACYFTYNAFLSKNNISKSKNIEFLLYLSTNKQIKIALKDFGLNYDKLKNQNCVICLISPERNLDIIYTDLKNKINLNEIKFEIDGKSIEKFNRIKNYFGITDDQLKVVLKSYKLTRERNKIFQFPLDDLFLALSDLIRERMVLLSLENININ